jgi:hypothetical protein
MSALPDGRRAQTHADKHNTIFPDVYKSSQYFTVKCDVWIFFDWWTARFDAQAEISLNMDWQPTTSLPNSPCVF